MIVNYSIRINKNTNYYSSPQIIIHKKKPWYMTFEIQFGCGRVKLVGSQRSFYIDNWISNGNTDINKQWKTCTDSLSLKWFLTITKILWPFKTRSLNTDDQHHKYQKNKQIPLGLNHWTQKKAMTYASENRGLGLVKYNSSTDKKKYEKLQRFAHSKKWMTS